MSGSSLERKPMAVPRDGVFRVIVDGTEHEYRLQEGDEIALEWEADPR